MYEFMAFENDVYRIMIILGCVFYLYLIFKTSQQFHKARESEVRYQTLINGSPVGIWQILPNGNTIYMNEATRHLLDIDSSQIQSSNLFSIIARNDPEYAENVFRKWINGIKEEAEFYLDSGNGVLPRHVVMNGAISHIVKDGVKTLIITIVDITQRKQFEKAIFHMANHDSLTGLPNRTLFLEKMNSGISMTSRHSGYMGILLLDLDKFKSVNDTLGHPIGDALLKEVAARLKDCVRESDIVCRLGGDEFAVIYMDIDNSEQLSNLAQRIINTINKPFSLNGNIVNTATSIGISVYPTDSSDVSSLINYADLALYAAKANGRGIYHYFDKKMDESIRRKKILEGEIIQALKNDEFILYFQPQFDLTSGDVVGIEGLIRWQHPTRGMVFPGEFVSVVEQSGLIVQLGEWVVNAACAQASIWQKKYPNIPFRISLNLSSGQFKTRNLSEVLGRIISPYQLKEGTITFEITESMILENTDYAIEFMTALKALGVGISIDDFGTGFSSIRYLNKFPIDSLKIDRSFIENILENADNAIIATSIINLAHTMGLQVIAEGVETQDQLTWLKDAGCDVAQGYHLGKPSTNKEVEGMVFHPFLRIGES